MSGEAPRLCILAGEESGDIYGAQLARALRALRPGTLLEGMGGARMEEAGVGILTDCRDLGGIGFVETHNKIAAFVKAYRDLTRLLSSGSYDAVVCIDCPELNLRLARYASRRGHRVVYFVTPQLWAWRSWRARFLRNYVERCLVVLPFEEEFLRARGVEAEYVGHPLVDMVRPVSDRAELLSRAGLDPSRPAVGLLPGSRRTEVFYSMPVLRAAAERLFEARPDLQFLLPVAPTVRRGQVEHYLEGHSFPLAVLDGGAQEAMSASAVSIVTSGTATLEAAILGVPMVIVYRGSASSYLLVRLLSRLTDYGLPNLVAGKRVVPELVQGGASPEAVAREALDILEDPARRQNMVAELGKVRSLLGDGGATERAAGRILDLLSRR